MITDWECQSVAEMSTRGSSGAEHNTNAERRRNQRLPEWIER
jgi:hypothetical protein